MCCFKRYHLAVVQHTRLNRSVARNIQHAPIVVNYQPRSDDLANTNIRAYQVPEERPRAQYNPPQGIIQQPQV